MGLEINVDDLIGNKNNGNKTNDQEESEDEELNRMEE
jgi:hypothetical protein